MKSDRKREIELLIRQISPKTLESQCLLGYPMKERLSQNELNDVVKFYCDNMKEPVRTLIKESKNIILDNRGKMF